MTEFLTYGDFARFLERNGELRRVSVEVDPFLEITEIATRALREGKPALWFEKVRGSRFPLVINGLATDRRCALALRKDPEELGHELLAFVEAMLPPRPRLLLKHRRILRRFLSTPVRRVRHGVGQHVIVDPDLDALPVITCWPGDGGRFITLPQVVTEDPRTGTRNMGMYRMQVFDRRTTGMHWQIQKGGGFHYYQAEKLGRPLELAVAIGTDPALLFATIAALPENIDEAMFAGFLRGRRTEFARAATLSMNVPAHAEFVLEGVVAPGERRLEGPFGDHFGHYSQASEFPVFHVKCMTHRRNAVYPATVVGIPPMEDKFLGDTTQRILGPLVRLLHSEISDMWAYYEAGFHNLLVVSVEQRYAKEGLKTALGLMGMSQLSLTKCIVLVSEGVNVRDFDAVMKEVGAHFDPHYDFVMIPKVPLDTLDFTSSTMNLGSKMILDATRKRRPEASRPRRTPLPDKQAFSSLRSLDRRITGIQFVHETLLLIRVRGQGREVLKKILRRAEVRHVAIVATVSEDVDITDRENSIWGVFTRFDAERDVMFFEQEMIGISPVYHGTMGIDATWKKGYPEPLRMSESVVSTVDALWGRIWKD